VFLFAHIGITVAVALAAEQVCRQRLEPLPGKLGDDSSSNSRAAGASLELPTGTRAASRRYWRALRNTIDYRLIAVGSVLPDVDKFIGLEVFQRFDRSVFHSLLCFLLLVVIAVWTFRRYRNTAGLQMTYCWVLHLVLDQMWLQPGIFLWPVYSIPSGGNFGVADFEGYMAHSLTTDPSQFVPELLGLAIAIWFAKHLVERRQVMAFLRMGRISGVEGQASPAAAAS
jgi:hypothetical protein